MSDPWCPSDNSALLTSSEAPPVIPHQISRVARTAILERMVDPLLGFNPLIAYQNSRYDLKPPINPIDTSSNSRNFIFGQLSAGVEIGTTSFRFPLIMLFSHGIMNKNFIKFRQFSGQVVMGIDVWYSWASSNVVHDYETYGDAIEEVIVEIVNGFGPSGNGEVTQKWGCNLIYNGNVSCSRTAVTTDAENWLQGYQFRFTFHLDTTSP